MYVAGNIPSSPLRKKRKDNRLILLYKGLKGKARIPTDNLIPKTRRGRNQHSLAFQIPSASKDVYKYSFFPQTIRDWNDLPQSLISSSELSDSFFLSLFLSILSRSNFDHHLRCGGWLNFEFSKSEKHSGWAIKTIYKKLCRGMLKHIPLYQ